MMLFYTVAAATLFASTVAVEFTVKSTGGNATSQYQYGLMFEDINNSGDGGVYAELVQNRAFQGDEVGFYHATNPSKHMLRFRRFFRAPWTSGRR